MTEGSSLT